MSRARATALALANWKGVFYERYLLDPHVTALEGANGAGKTTVLIAAYVVLLPDMSRLRFANVGETGATGGDRGIWGRLGELGRPSYAAMEIALPNGTNLIAGVHLERKAEPSIALTPFVVSEVRLEGRMRELLLVGDGQHDAVPDLGELRANVAASGGKIQVFDTAKDYFGFLFDEGVLPLRMATDEDRNKYAEMLRTSMTGGMSRVLSTELRSFLLKEETGLSDALSRMRANLDACHRTRVEVGDAGRLEREIRGVLDASQAVFSAAMLAAHATFAESMAVVEASRGDQEKAIRQERELEAELSDALAQHSSCVVRWKASRAAWEQASAWRERLVKTRACADRVAMLDAELERSSALAREAECAKATAADGRAARREDCERFREAYERSARGVADWQTGLEELHKNAHAHRVARRSLARAREVLPALTEAEVEVALESLRSRARELDGERARADADVRSAEIRRDEYDRALAALVEIDGDAQPTRAHDRAREVLALLVDLDGRARRGGELAEDLARATRMSERQAMARARAADLGLERWEGTAVAAVEERLSVADAEVRAAEDEARVADERRISERAAGEATRRRLADLERAAERWSESAALMARVEAAIGRPVQSAEELADLRSRGSRARDEARERRHELQRTRDDRKRRSEALDLASATIHPELARLRDELGGELLVARYEDADPLQAGRMEAELGPLVDAIVVADPEAAALSLVGQPREVDTVWLVAADAPLTEGHATVHGGDVWVRESVGLRIDRIPGHSTLGRRARIAQASAMREEVEQLDQSLAEATEKVRAADALASDMDRLSPEMLSLRSIDFASERSELDALLVASEASERAAGDHAMQARERARAARGRVEAWRSLLGEALLLAPPDWRERTSELEQAWEQSVAAEREIHRVAVPRRVLSELLESLRAPPESRASSLEKEAARRGREAERERIFGALEALETLAGVRHALAFADSEAALSERTSLLPALEEQLAEARARLRAVEGELSAAEQQWEKATAAWQVASAAREAVSAERLRAVAELDACGIQAVSEGEWAAAEQSVVEREQDRKALEKEERHRATHVELLRERHSRACAYTRSTRAKLAADEAAAVPVAERWSQVRARAESAGLLAFARLATSTETEFGRTAAAIASDVQGRAEVLVDRLVGARGGEDCAQAIRALMRGAPRAPSDVAFDVWMRAKQWAKERLPAQVADVAEPMEALERLRSDLRELEDRLIRQESELRGASEDVARGIDVQLRRASSQVRRLNQRLEGLAFGAVAGIRVEIRRIERMQQVLGALREGAVQELLFDPTMPIEHALSEIFRRYGAGRTGGSARILDYREYIELAVEIRRRQGGPWEPAHPTRLSTGEAIGVGAALMMVVLTEWEHDATLLRTRRVDGSLCLLFLDEANRLSQDNLGVLFDLCKSLDLQLLIAAPEVARAEGNTTYRLVRGVTADGQDEVLVTGRRIRESV